MREGHFLDVLDRTPASQKQYDPNSPTRDAFPSDVITHRRGAGDSRYRHASSIRRVALPCVCAWDRGNERSASSRKMLLLY
ncbi:hypothetical protein FKM82_030322 [Ascaphus truei]